MIERVLEHLGRPRRRPRPCWPSATGRTPSSDAYPDGALRRRRAPLRRRARAPRHRRRHPLRRRSTPASTSASWCVNGDVLTDLDVGALVARHERAGRRGHDRPAPGRGPVRLRRGAHRRRRPGHRVHREAAARRGAHRPHQRRHLRARAVGARPHRARRAGERRAGHLPGHGGRRLALRRRRRHLLDRRRHAGHLPGRPTSTSSTAARPRVEAGVHPDAEVDGAVVGVGGRAPARTSPTAPSCRGSVVLRRRGHRRGRRRAGCHHRRPGPGGRGRGASRRARSSATTWWCRLAPSCTGVRIPEEGG